MPSLQAKSDDFRRELAEALLAIDMSSPNAAKNRPLESYLSRTFGWENVVVKSAPNTNATDNRLSEALRKRPAPREGLLMTVAEIRQPVVQASKKFVGHGNDYNLLLIATRGRGSAEITDIIYSAGVKVPTLITEAFPNASLHEVGVNKGGEATAREVVKPGLERILGEYPRSVREPLKDHPLAGFIRKEWPATIHEHLKDVGLASEIHCSGTKFMGNWASVPWVGIRHERLAPSFRTGTYCVYLFSEDGSRVVLSLGRGVAQAQPALTSSNLSTLFAELPPPAGFTTGSLDPRLLASTGGALAGQYARATLIHHIYERDSLPPENDLQRDLEAIVRYLHELADSRAATSLLGGGMAEANPEEWVEEPLLQPKYEIASCAEQTGFREGDLRDWLSKLRRKKHLIIQGPPGTGKTYLAGHLARLLLSETLGRFETVQFHPSYSYEDFVQGIRPELVEGQLIYIMRPGRFLQFCATAKRLAPAPFVLIIDEMNRGNLSRIFGELLYLLEYRDSTIPLAQEGTRFSVPENVYLIGTMNTADRSIALFDHALRRRFSFVFLAPDYELLAGRLRKWGLNPEQLIEVLEQLNRTIGDRNYHIGTSYFLAAGPSLRERLPEIWEGEIEPFLDEYFFDQISKVDPFRWARVGPTISASWGQRELGSQPQS